MAPHGRRAVLSLTTRFCLPHEGMATLDYLSSGSAVVLRGTTSSSLAVVTCQHYFTATWDWLQFVNEDHVRHSLQLLAVDESNSRPDVLLELPLAPQVHTHESRDLALLTLVDSAALESWQQAEQELGVQTLTLQQAPCERGDAASSQATDNYSSGQEFAWSQELLEEGMCGGAVVGAATDQCVGIVEGIVPTIMRQALAGHVAFIPASDVRKFIEEPDDLLLTGMELPPRM
ncbi:Peptidase S1, PA clan [Phytophthora cactorum]|nr:Peptidase S1, PA clan [Phytophthora cactorum]